MEDDFIVFNSLFSIGIVKLVFDKLIVPVFIFSYETGPKSEKIKISGI